MYKFWKVFHLDIYWDPKEKANFYGKKKENFTELVSQKVPS